MRYACAHYEGRFHKENTLRAKEADYHMPIAAAIEGNEHIKQALITGQPFCAARLGSTELAIVDYMDRCQGGGKREMNPVDRWLCFQSMQYRGWRGSGIFPPSAAIIRRFAERFLGDLAQVDVMGVWYNHHEDRILNKFAPQAKLCDLRGLEPYYHEPPWSEALAGKRVVVVHPFARSIEKQFAENRARLFQDPRVLPEFELRVIPAVQSLLEIPHGFANWFDALQAMQEDLEAQPFDVAIIGAGAYGLPLAVHAKRLGGVAIHMAGATQILFGIRGRRWDTHPEISRLMNDFWIRPGLDETPQYARRVEDGCYW